MSDHVLVTLRASATSFNIPQKEGEGQDADPLVLVMPAGMALGVFDGMGGAGAETYSTSAGRQTGAYVASRLAREVSETWFTSHAGRYLGEASIADLKQRLVDAFARRHAELGAAESRLRSKLIRSLPTTAAIIIVTALEDGGHNCNFIWAGDSRGYLLTPEAGLIQMTVDHLRDPSDPFENLKQDSPLVNHIAADADFYLEINLATIRGRFVALAASDGCFGYLASPILFETLLLDTMHLATDLREWRRALADAVSAATGDDASMALATVGWESFDEVRRSFANRWKSLTRGAAREIADARTAVEAARLATADAEARYGAVLQRTWERYRHRYQFQPQSYKV